jgi:HAD superfamily hydrolase (TIGR01509 family)
MMEKTALKKYFDAVISAENVKIGKPDPEIYIKIFCKLKVDPGEVVVVEDNENGILAATLSGAHVLRVENPNQVTFERVLNFIDEVVG